MPLPNAIIQRYTLVEGKAQAGAEDYLATARAQIVENLFFAEFSNEPQLLDNLVYRLEGLLE